MKPKTAPVLYRITTICLSVGVALPAATYAATGSPKSDLEKAQETAREIVNPRDTSQGAASVTGNATATDGIPAMEPAGSRRTTSPEAQPKSWRGISSARLRGMLSICPASVQENALGSLKFLNATWTGTLSDRVTGLKECLGEKGFARLASLLKSVTYADRACKDISGACVNINDHLCNDADCYYYAKNSGTARKDESCWKDGRCYYMPSYNCNKVTCERYPYDAGGGSAE